MLEIIHHVLPEAFFDVLKTVPLLLIVYALLYYIENRLTNTPELLSRAAQFGPVVGALAGSIPQCGFSAAARCSRQAFSHRQRWLPCSLPPRMRRCPSCWQAAQAYSRSCCCSWSSLRSRSSAAIFCAAPCSVSTKPEPTARLRSRWATAAVRPRRWRTSCPTPSRPPSSCLSCCSRSTWSYTASARSVSLPSC